MQLEHLRFERATCLCPQTASPFSQFVQGTPTGRVGFELLGPARAGPPAQTLIKSQSSFVLALGVWLLGVVKFLKFEI